MSLETIGLSKDSVVYLGCHDGLLPKRNDKCFEGEVDKLSKLLDSFQPSDLFCPHPLEGWPDHEAAEALTRTAISRMENPPALYHYCVWFWYSMPLARAWRCDWKNALTLDISEVYEKKRRAIAAYMEPCAPCGKPWSGNLPKEFLKAFAWKKELFFKVENL